MHSCKVLPGIERGYKRELDEDHFREEHYCVCGGLLKAIRIDRTKINLVKYTWNKTSIGAKCHDNMGLGSVCEEEIFLILRGGVC